jgi:predicted permease
LVAIATLAIGIGSNAAIFSVVHAVLLRPLPFPAADRLVAVHTRYLPSTGYDFPYFALSGPEFVDVRDRVPAFASVAAYGFAFRNLSMPGAEAERILTMPVAGEFFAVLGVAAAQGRTFTAEEAQREGSCIAVVAHDLATRTGAPLAGSTIRLDDAPCDVVGVMPPGFGFRDDRVRIWTGWRIDMAESPVNRASHGLLGIARLREGIEAAEAGAELQALRTQWSSAHPDHYAKGHFAVFRALQDDLVGDRRQALWLLGGAVLFVMLIVCVNLAALLVSRNESRRRELAVRHAMGATRRRLMRQLLVEAMLLTCLGGALGLILADWLLSGLLALYPQQLPAWRTIAVDHRTAIFAMLLVVAAGFVVGLAPAVGATGARLRDSLTADSRGATGTRRAALVRSALVVAQLALSLVLVAGAVLLARSYQELQRVDLGFDPEGVLTFTVSVPVARQPDAAAARRMIAAIADRLAGIGGVETAAVVSHLPLASAGPPDDFSIDGRATPGAGEAAWNARYLMVTPRAFAALRIPLERGRLLAESDGPNQPLVAVINETAARTYWPGEDPIGRTIRYYPLESSSAIRIVGIVGDIRSLGPATAPPPAVYVPYAQAPRPGYDGRSMTFVVRTGGNPTALAPAAREAVAAVDASLPLASVRPMMALISVATSQSRFTAVVMGFFATVAFFLAALGLYGIQAYGVEQRRREIGVRMALGADAGRIFRLIVGSGVRLAAIGLAVGLPAALLCARVLEGLLSGVTSSDPLTYAAVTALLVGAALLASYLPARRATRVDPLTALRAE